MLAQCLYMLAQYLHMFVRARLMNPWKEEGFIVSKRERKASFDLLNQSSFTPLPPPPLPPQPRAKSLIEAGPRWKKGRVRLRTAGKKGECGCENRDRAEVGPIKGPGERRQEERRTQLLGLRTRTQTEKGKVVERGPFWVVESKEFWCLLYNWKIHLWMYQRASLIPDASRSTRSPWDSRKS